MTIAIIMTTIVLGIGSYLYRASRTFNEENTAKAAPLAAQIPIILKDYDVLDSETRVRVKRIHVYDDFALMLTINQAKKGRFWDFNLVNKKIATDSNKCIRLHLAFHCKNEPEFILYWTPKTAIKENELNTEHSINDLFEGEFESTFLIKSNNKKRAVAFLDKATQTRLLEIEKENKGAWLLQKNTLTYKEAIEIDSDKKRQLLYQIMDLGFELAKRVDE